MDEAPRGTRLKFVSPSSTSDDQKQLQHTKGQHSGDLNTVSRRHFCAKP